MTELTGVPKGERAPDRRLTNRNGYEPRRRAERALLAVVQEPYVLGVSTRRVDDLVRVLGLDGISQERLEAR